MVSVLVCPLVCFHACRQKRVVSLQSLVEWLYVSAIGVVTQHIHTCGICTAAACQGAAPPARRLTERADRHGRWNSVMSTYQVADFWGDW